MTDALALLLDVARQDYYIAAYLLLAVAALLWTLKQAIHLLYKQARWKAYDQPRINRVHREMREAGARRALR